MRTVSQVYDAGDYNLLSFLWKGPPPNGICTIIVQKHGHAPAKFRAEKPFDPKKRKILEDETVDW